MKHLPGFQIQNIEAYVTAQANISDAVAAVHRVREDAALPYVLELPDHLFVSGVKYRETGLASQKHESPIQADQAVVRRRADMDAFDQLPGSGVQDQHSAIRSEVPIAGRHVDFLAVQRDGGSVRTAIVGFVPDNVFGFQIEGSHPAVAGG